LRSCSTQFNVSIYEKKNRLFDHSREEPLTRLRREHLRHDGNCWICINVESNNIERINLHKFSNFVGLVWFHFD